MVDLAKKPTFVRNFFIFFAGLLVLAAIGYGGWRIYRKWEPVRLAKRARIFFQKGDLANATLTIRHAMSINPNDLPINRLVAEIAESSGDPTAVAWRYRLLDLQPRQLTAAIECAQTALRFGQPKVAAEVLRTVQGEDKTKPRYHELAGLTASALHQFTPALEHFAEAVRLEPQNEAHRLNYATALIDRGWIEDRSGARDILKGLRATPAIRVAALRALVRDALAAEELTVATELARDLAAEPDAAFSDQITFADLLHRTRSPEFSGVLASLKHEARGKPGQIAEVIQWLDRRGLAREGVAWSEDFSVEEWSDPRVCAAVACCSLALSAWPQLEALTQGSWQRLDYVRAALRARALREQGNFHDSLSPWSEAVSAAAAQPGTTALLARLIADWGWTAEFESLLRSAVSERAFGDDWALQAYLPVLVRKKDTAALWEVTSRLMEKNPESDAIANNFAIYSLLLRRESTRACEIAGRLYTKHPREAKYVSTHAYALHVLGRSERALQVMQTLSPEQLETPDIAAYYGVLLAATQDRAGAEHFLTLAKTAVLLPEEEALLRSAWRQLELIPAPSE